MGVEVNDRNTGRAFPGCLRGRAEICDFVRDWGYDPERIAGLFRQHDPRRGTHGWQFHWRLDLVE